MIDRRLIIQIKDRLSHVPAVVLLGPRQVGKTTLARVIAQERDALYLDLERQEDIDKLRTNTTSYLLSHEQHLVVIDEIQHYPELFMTLRGLIDIGRQQGKNSNRFLLLGSASMELMHQSESLAGRVSYLQLNPLDVWEVEAHDIDKLWLRGGFPQSFLSANDKQSFIWREDFITSYLRRDMRQAGIDSNVAATTLHRLWTMLAHCQGSPLNLSSLAGSLGIKAVTVGRYIDIFHELLLVRKLTPWYRNSKKRLVKSPKIYLRDSGITHTLLRLADKEMLLGHPIVGASWEAFAIENILSRLPTGCQTHFYRTSSGAEIDLLIAQGTDAPWAIEIKRSDAPSRSRALLTFSEGVVPRAKFVVYAGDERYPLGRGIEAIGLREMCQEVSRNFNHS